ncbi:MAG: glycoside hydrolase family 43 protein [Clostridiales bacterium]|nr:glycoside hydrolase family 43 protein [Clostridiales bacterium]
MKTRVCFLLLAVLLLAGCAPKPPDGPMPEADPVETEDPHTITLARDGKTDFVLICDLGADDTVRADYFRIRDVFRDRYGADLPILDSGGREEHDCEIVLAVRNRPACADLMKELSSGEYAIRAVRDPDTGKTKILIAYKGGFARMYAIETFLNVCGGGGNSSVPDTLDLNGKAGDCIIKSAIERLRDPCVLVENGTYYAYGTGWHCYKNTSGSLAGPWTDLGVVVDVPAHAKDCHWAPEVHRYNGKFYMFTTYLSDENNHRGCTILVSDTPEGPFSEITGGHLTPKTWDSIDGTFYVDPDGQPWMVFVHEWTSTDDGVGRMAAAKLADDLTHFVSEPVELFRADDAPWAKNGVTDGCWMYRTADGQLLMLWSNWDSAGYCVGIARSASGSVEGPWTQDERLLYSKSMTGTWDGGHGMLFTDTDGQMYLSIHSPNSPDGNRYEKPIFIPVREEDGTLVWDLRG